MATDVPTDPEEYALYMMYGDNWRQFVGERYNTRDRGGRYDYNLHFYNSVPYVALIKNIVDTLQAQTDFVTSMQPPEGIDDYENQYNIWAEHLAALNSELTDYRGKIENYQFDPKDLEEHYAYLPYDGPGGISQPSVPDFPPPFESPAQPAFPPNRPQPAKPPANDATIFENGNTGTTTRQPYVIQPAAQQTTAAYLQMAKNNAATAAVASPQERDNSYAAPAPAPTPTPAPAPAPALPPAKPTMSDQFISRYERAEAIGSDNPKVKTVTPTVKTITKKVKSI